MEGMDVLPAIDGVLAWERLEAYDSTCVVAA